MMLYLAVWTALLYAGYFCLGKILPAALLWYCKRNSLPELTVGSIKIFSLSFFNIRIIKDGVIVHIDKVKIASSFFSRDITRPVHIILHDIRIERDLADVTKTKHRGKTVGKETPKETNLFSGRHSLPHATPSDLGDGSSPFKFIEVPPRVFSMVQFVGIEILNGDVILRESGSLLMATVEHASLHGTLLTPRSGSVTLSMSSLAFRLMSRNVRSENEPSDSCLAQVKINIHAETQFSSCAGLRFSDMKCSVEKPEVTILDPYAVINCSLKPATSFSSESRVNRVYRWLSVLPGTFEFNVRDVTGRVSETNSFSIQRFSIKWSGISAISGENFECDVSDEAEGFSANVELAHLDVETGNREKIFGVDYFNHKLKIAPEFSDIDASADFHTCWLCFDPLTVPKTVEWLNFMRKQRDGGVDEGIASTTPRTPFYTPGPGSRRRPSESSLRKFFGNAGRLSVTVDFRDVRGVLRPNASKYAETFGGSQIQLKIRCEDAKKSPSGLPDVFFETTVDKVTSSLIKLDASSRDSSPPSDTKFHTWGNVFGVGVGMITLHWVNQALKIQAVFDRCQAEWSDELRDFLLDSLHPFTALSPPSSKYATGKTDDIPSFSGVDFVLNAQRINLFLMSEGGFCLNHRFDQVIVNVEENKQQQFQIIGSKIVSMFESDEMQVPLDESEAAWGFGTTIFAVKNVVCELTKEHKRKRELVVKVAGTISALWESRVHLAYLHVYRSVRALSTTLKSRFENGLRVRDDGLRPGEAAKDRGILAVYFDGRIKFDAILSPEHTFELRTGRLEVKNEWNNPVKGLHVRTDSLTVGFDNHPDIFTVRQIDVQSLPVPADWSEFRACLEEVTAPKNRAWKWSMSSFSYKLPYNYNFARSFNEELMAVKKWIKKVHGLSSEPFKPDGRLPADTIINIGTFRFELSDDPFEIKLRENYSLLEDEAKERAKREEALTREIKKRFANQLESDAYLKELSEKLERKGAEIYIMRSKKMSDEAQNGACPTQLFTWVMTDVSVVALADPSFHGKAGCLRVVQELDPCSPLPSEAEMSFSILWCRAVDLICSNWTFRLRDYPQPLLDIRQFHAWGRLVGAEQSPTWRATRLSKVHIGHPWCSTEVERGMMPLKFYHGLDFDINYFQLAYGPCWEPALAQFNLSMENVFAPSIDPSPPLPFWDKIRIKYHGFLWGRIRKMTLLLHASLDPYNTTEEMALHWSNLIFDWRNAKFMFAGELEVSVRTASKYDDCRLLHLPHAKLVIKLAWKCSLGNADDHHGVSPCSPHRLPEYSSNVTHDSYRAFRSDNLDLNVSLDTRPPPGGGDGAKNGAAASVLFFASTCRWFENLKFILSGVSRPIRKGRLFKNQRPRKTPLSRHYKRVSFSISLDRIRVSYWMSAARQKGMQLSGGPLSLSSTHVLALVPVDDGLKHRPLASWSILAMTCSLFDSEIWLMSALSPEEIPSPPAASEQTKDADKKNSTASAPDDRDDEMSVSGFSLASTVAASVSLSVSTFGGGGSGSSPGLTPAASLVSVPSVAAELAKPSPSGLGDGLPPPPSSSSSSSAAPAGNDGSRDDGRSGAAAAATPSSPSPSASSHPRVEKRFFVSLSRTEYVRETPVHRVHPGLDPAGVVVVGVGGGAADGGDVTGNPIHKLVVDNLRGAWTVWNKDVVMSLVDGWRKSQALRKNLSRDVLKSFSLAGQEAGSAATTPGGGNPSGASVVSPALSHQPGAAAGGGGGGSGGSGGGGGSASSAGAAASSNAAKVRGLIEATPPDPTMLRKLIDDLENSVAVCEDIEVDASEEPLHGQMACLTDDVVSLHWNIELVNSQVLLRGCESHGYIIVCASKAQIMQREHHPVWRDKCLVSKNTWVGSFDGLQYYATVSARHSSRVAEIVWLSKENIDDRNATVIADLPDLPDMVGSGHSVGGVVSTVVGTSAVEAEDGNFDIELQRIVSRCKCEFFFVFYGDVSLEPGELKQVPPPPPADLDIWNSNHEPFDAYTLKHHDLHVSTNPLQYAMILDIVSNLVLQAQPRKKELDERLQTLRFETQLHSVDDQRKPILELQNEVRRHVVRLRHLEREIYLVQKEVDEFMERPPFPAACDDRLLQRMRTLNQLAGEVKEKLYSQSEELNLKLSVYNECQIAAHNAVRRRYLMSQGDMWGGGAGVRHAGLTRSIELCFTQAQWRLTEADGQIGISDLVLRNFLFKKVTKSDESSEHLAELGYISVKNLIPNDVYTDVLRLTEIQSNMPMARRQRAVRVFYRDKPPVGGIPIKEHFEINLAPVNIALTQQFYKKLMKFLYPGKDPDSLEEEKPTDAHGGSADPHGGDGRGSKGNKGRKGGGKSGSKAGGRSKANTSFYVDIQTNDVEKMKRRAEENKMFVYVKMTELPVRLSYKGENKVYNCEDLRVTVPPMEVHNITWTWRDFLMAIKDHCKMMVFTQFFKQKIKPRGFVAMGAEEAGAVEEEAAEAARAPLRRQPVRRRLRRAPTSRPAGTPTPRSEAASLRVRMRRKSRRSWGIGCCRAERNRRRRDSSIGNEGYA